MTGWTAQIGNQATFQEQTQRWILPGFTIVISARMRPQTIRFLKQGIALPLKRVWVGNSNDPNESGVLTVESGASLTTSGDFNLENNSTVTSSGAILVNTGNGMILRDNSNLTLLDGATLNKLNLNKIRLQLWRLVALSLPLKTLTTART